jgi:lysozyme
MAQTRPTQPGSFDDLQHLPGPLPSFFVKGVDVSHHNGSIDWLRLRQAGVDFVYIKTTEGVGTPDPMAQTHALGARSAGLKTGYYHFCRPSPKSGNAAIVADAEAEASDFKKALKNLPKADLPPVMDLEDDGPNVPSAPSDFLLWAQTMALALFDPAAVLPYPVIYSRAEYLDRRLPPGHKLGATCKLWLSRYTADYRKALPGKGWADWSIWQFTEQGLLLPNKLLDLNIWRRDEYTALLSAGELLAVLRPVGFGLGDDLHAELRSS